MGDGRYYTYYQFLNIVLNTFLTIFAVASAVYGYYRLSDKRNIKHAYAIFSFVIIFAILHVVETVTPNLAMAIAFRNIKSAIMITLVCYYIFYSKFMWRELEVKSETLSQLKSILLVCYSLGMFFIMISGLLVEDYKFNMTTYSKSFKAIILILLITYLISGVNELMAQIRHRLNRKGCGSDAIVMILRLLFLSPLLIYTLALCQNSARSDFIEILICFGYIFLVNLNLYTHDESGITMHAFDKMGDMSLDCIFVTDRAGKILYKNKSSRNSSFFESTEVIEIGRIQTLFKDEIVIKSNHLGREYIVLKHNEHKHYFAFKSGELKEHSKVIGNIITITEITELINLLNILEERQTVSKEINQKLKKHALVVYRLEKEKEISTLLEEIINSREIQMNILAQMIDQLKINMDSPFFESDIEASIQKCNVILEDVRKTVSSYKAYYGEDVLTESIKGRYR